MKTGAIHIDLQPVVVYIRGMSSAHSANSRNTVFSKTGWITVPSVGFLGGISNLYYGRFERRENIVGIQGQRSGLII